MAGAMLAFFIVIRRFVVSVAMLVTAAFYFSCLAHAEYIDDIPLDTKLNEQVVFMEVGVWMPASLQVTFFKPDGDGPFPLAIINHGKGPNAPADEPRYRTTYAARYLLSRGYAVILPMMRGFAGSSGRSWITGCNIETISNNNANDIHDLFVSLSKTKIAEWLDLDRVIMIGAGLGGVNSFAAGTKDIPGLRGIVNFYADFEALSCRNLREAFVGTMKNFSSDIKVPTMLFYGERDNAEQLLGLSEMESIFRSNRVGFEAVKYPRAFDQNRNFLGTITSLPVWIPKMDEFLGRIRMPNRNIHPELLPNLYPPPSGYADINNINAVPIDDVGKAAYRVFLGKQRPRIFMIATNGSTISTEGGYDPLERARTLCAQYQLHCQVYAIDDYVAWTIQTPAPPASGFASLVDDKAVPYIDVIGRQGYLQFLLLPPPRAFAIAPDGAWFISNNDFDVQASALRKCSAEHDGCKIYAVNDRVVWAWH